MPTAVLTPAAAIEAVAGFDRALDDLLAVVDHDSLVGAGADVLTRVLQDVERVRNRMARLDHEMVAAAETVNVADRVGCRSTAVALTQILRIERAEAHARVRAAAQLRDRRSATGQPMAPVRPALAAALGDGQASAGVSAIALRALDKAQSHGASPTQMDQGEQVLADCVGVFGPDEMRRVARRIAEHVDPDDALGEDRYHDQHRSVTFRKTKDGSWRIEGRLTPLLGQQWDTILAPLMKARDTADTPDDRTPEQRRHDAFQTIAQRLLRSGDLPDAGGIPATVVATIDYALLLEAARKAAESESTGADADAPTPAPLDVPTLPDGVAGRPRHGRLSDGTPIAAETLLDWACEAEIIPAVLSASGEILSLGRSRRVADKNQTLALHARDGGCSFPGCDIPPLWCERHHIVAWIKDGLTDLDNLTLLCWYHHHNFKRLRWRCIMRDGLPWWVPPPWVDSNQTPTINRRLVPAGTLPGL